MSVRSLVNLMRTREAAMAESTCTITRLSDGPSFTDGTFTDATSTTVFSGACQIRAATSDARLVEAGETEINATDLLVKLPHTVDVERDDTITVTDSPDSRLVGRTLVVRFVVADDWQVVRRVVAREEED